MDEELLKRLRAMGVKSFSHVDAGSFSVEFFPQAVATISPLDLDTLVPPAPAPGEEVEEVTVPPAIARILKRGSVS